MVSEPVSGLVGFAYLRFNKLEIGCILVVVVVQLWEFVWNDGCVAVKL